MVVSLVSVPDWIEMDIEYHMQEVEKITVVYIQHVSENDLYVYVQKQETIPSSTNGYVLEEY